MSSIIDDAFNDTPDVPLKTPQAGEDSGSFGQFGAIQVGGLGAKAFRTDDQGIWLGAIKFVDAPFSVSMEGAIKGISGSIAGWTVGTTTITKNNATLDSAGQITLGTADDVAILSSVNTTYRLWIGDATAGDATFSVTKGGVLYATGANISGAITATSGTIGGFTIQSSYLYAGSGANTAGLSPADYPFWAGDTYANRATAPFRVTPAGALYASSVDVSGKVVSGANSAYTGNQIAEAYIGNLSAAKITSGTIVVGGTSQPTALTIQESSLTGNARLGWQRGSRMWEDSASDLGMNAIGGDIWMYCASTWRLLVTESGGINVNGYVTCKSINLNQDQVEGSINAVDRIEGYNDLRFKGNGDVYFYRDTSDGAGARIQWGTGKIFSYSSTIELGGYTLDMDGTNKTAIVPTSQGYNALYCIESPEVWFMDFCVDLDKIDPMFLEVTEGEMEFIKCESGKYQVWRRRKGHENKRFESKTFEEFQKNEQYLSMAKVVK